MNSTSIISELIQKVLMHAFLGTEGMLNLEVHRNSFNKGELIQLLISQAEGSDLRDLSLQAVHGTDTLEFVCVEERKKKEYYCSRTLLFPGEYTFFADAYLPNGTKIISNKTSAIIQDINIEMKELIQERQALMEISYKTGGTYTSIDSLDTMLAHIDITPVQRIINHQLSSLSVQKYWWILILFLLIEWYVRKRRGLL